MPRRFQPGCPCCDCQYFFDNYERTAGTDVGGNYTEQAEDWSIYDGGTNKLLYVAASNARLSIDVAHPSAVASTVCGFVFAPITEGDEVRFIFNYQDADNYHFVQAVTGGTLAEQSAGTKFGRIEIWERSGGTNTRLAWRMDAIFANRFSVMWVFFGEHSDGHDYVAAYTYDLLETIVNYSPHLTIRRQVVEYRGLTLSNDDNSLATGSIASHVFFDQLVLHQHYSTSARKCYEANSCMVLDADPTQPDAEVIASDFDSMPIGFTFTFKEVFNELWIFESEDSLWELWFTRERCRAVDLFLVNVLTANHVSVGVSFDTPLPRTSGIMAGDVPITIVVPNPPFSPSTYHVTFRFDP